MIRYLHLVAVIVAAAAGPALAQSGEDKAILVTEAWSRATSRSSPTAVAYLTVQNIGRVPDRLVGASSSAASAVELHETRMEAGIARMKPVVDGLALPAGATVKLAPGGLHLMLIGPTRPFLRGETVPLTLMFERGGQVATQLAVEAPGASSPTHTGH